MATHSALTTGAQSKGLEALVSGKRWSRDLALIGGITGFAAPAVVIAEVGVLPMVYAAATGAAGLLSGATLGLLMPRLLGWRALRKLSLPWLVLGGLAVGGHWGGLVGVLAGAAVEPALIGLSAVTAAVAGSLQFGWMWLPYAVRLGRGKSARPILAAAAAMAPALGYAALGAMGVVGSFLGLMAF